MTDLTPREIVSELDRYIVGQSEAKRAVAVALRARWRRRRLPEPLRSEVTPKNILMIGPTGVGKTEISRRLARLARAPFVKVEATKFTEVGYVGRDVEQIIRDLVEVALAETRARRREEARPRARQAAEERILDALCGAGAREATREAFRRRLHAGELDAHEVELELTDQANPFAALDLPGLAGGPGGAPGGMVNLGELFGKALGGGRRERRRMTVAEGLEALTLEEAEKLLDQESLAREALEAAEQDGIVFIDEIDKICAREGVRGADVSREGVQRDLLPLIEGAAVTTRHGVVRTDHILFIASGAFHLSKPSDLLPELQGRLPIRVELRALTEEDFVRILTETDNALTRQYAALMATEGVEVTFAPDGVRALAEIAAKVNRTVENIGARRLHTVMERVFEELSFTAPDRPGQQVTIDRAYVEARLADLADSSDVSRFVL
ncbi:ATP-dependent protease ATPase subunit HslU [Oceanicella actignis]|uniref:ATP-dependent protease ATPase subunit HslU n=1 Tax=Oceanicella actignis TaxID=1189325 RepID=A0A1M7S370_9RHOB|nr:ATP-dependent protease ATPase subunit HslU [Oceanicella actignis]SES89573.1 ATP-dependent HslUV protease ATP-binding subunit HslU [Oceanicella actignis]SHN52883.1 ATP-dependent HslUV protease ATP-binding subunit HslU [Oceanicella actignis]